jgi:hypothetical protein
MSALLILATAFAADPNTLVCGGPPPTVGATYTALQFPREKDCEIEGADFTIDLPEDHPVIETGVIICAGSNVVVRGLRLQGKSARLVVNLKPGATGLVVEGNSLSREKGQKGGVEVNAQGGGSNVVLRGNIIPRFKGEHAMIVRGPDEKDAGSVATLREVRVVDNTIGGPTGKVDTSTSEALTIKGRVTEFRVLRNVIQGYSNIGIDIIGNECEVQECEAAKAHPFIPTQGVVANNLVYDYRHTGNPADGAAIYLDGTIGVTVTGNATRDARGRGIEVSAENPGVFMDNSVEKNYLDVSKSVKVGWKKRWPVAIRVGTSVERSKGKATVTRTKLSANNFQCGENGDGRGVVVEEMPYSAVMGDSGPLQETAKECRSGPPVSGLKRVAPFPEGCQWAMDHLYADGEASKPASAGLFAVCKQR